MSLDKMIREQVRDMIRKKQKGGQEGMAEQTYDEMVKGLNSIAHIAKSWKIPQSDIPAASTSGNPIHLVKNMFGFVETTLNTVADAVIAADSIIALPSNLGKAYNEPLAHQNFTF